MYWKAEVNCFGSIHGVTFWTSHSQIWWIWCFSPVHLSVRYGPLKTLYYICTNTSDLQWALHTIYNDMICCPLNSLIEYSVLGSMEHTCWILEIITTHFYLSLVFFCKKMEVHNEALLIKVNGAIFWSFILQKSDTYKSLPLIILLNYVS